MSTHPLVQVDAFTDRPLGGNPCAVVLDADDLDEATRLAIAKEMNLSETAFVVRSEKAEFGARYFTPTEEIPLAGHPTVATVLALVDAGRLALRGAVTRISLELKVGPVDVDIHASPRAGEDAGGWRVERVVMSQKPPRFLRVYEAEEVLPVFGLAAELALAGAPIQTVSTGTAQLMIPLRAVDTLREARPRPEPYRRLRERGDFFSPHLFALGGATPRGATFARHFGPPPDAMEDPFTGSATGGMAAYLWHHGLIASPELVAEQGHWMGRPGEASVEVVGPREAIETVKVGGGGVVVLRGELVV